VTKSSERESDRDTVKGLRDRLGWSQTELARFLCVADTTVARWEAQGDNARHMTGHPRELFQALEHATRDREGLERVRESASSGATMRTLLRKALGSSGEDDTG